MLRPAGFNKQKPPEYYYRFLWCYDPGSPRPPHKDPIQEYVSLGAHSLREKLTGDDRRTHLDVKVSCFCNSPRSFNETAQMWKESKGFVQLKETDPDPGKYTPPFKKGWQKLAITAQDREDMAELIHLCERAGAVLVIRVSPFSVEADPQEDASELLNYLDELGRTSSQVIVPKPVLMVFEHDYLVDALHCNEMGVRRLTDMIADEVLQALGQRSRTAPERAGDEKKGDLEHK